MSDFRNRPNDNYNHEADWQQLYRLTEQWKSDLLFYRDDLKFLHHLISKCFMYISKKENLDMVREIEVGLLETDTHCNTLLDRTKKHLHHLAELIDDPFKNDSHKFRTEHEQLEDNIAHFVQEFRSTLKEVFKITEYVIESEEMVRQINFTT